MIWIGAQFAIKIMYAVYANSHGKPQKRLVRYGIAKGFLIEEIAPAAYRLREHQTRRYAVHKAQETDFFLFCIYNMQI